MTPSLVVTESGSASVSGSKTIGFKDDSDADSDSDPEIALACIGENYNETVIICFISIDKQHYFGILFNGISTKISGSEER